MIKSMTGYGKADCEVNSKKITVEVKSLNSKQTDINVRIPNSYREKELTYRSLLSQQLERGKIDLSISVESLSGEAPITINMVLAKQIHAQIKVLGDAIGEESSNILPLLIKMPDVMKSEKIEITTEEWVAVQGAVEMAIKYLNDFREDEGRQLEIDIESRVVAILESLKTVENHEEERIGGIKDRIKVHLNSLTENMKIDENRFEQELIYYLEKLDINEEKVRLSSHCKYFKETMNLSSSNGKKLNFIAQEMGREINTIGSKANNAHIQKSVVLMKDHLEKIKEQVLNVL